MSFYWLFIGVLCVWRLTHLLQAEDGPWDAVVMLRKWLGDSQWGRLLDCFNCLSIWIAAPLAYLIGEGAWEQVLIWPALSGAAILLERITSPSMSTPAVPFFEETTYDDDMLRTK